jgi:hypothetical protein
MNCHLSLEDDCHLNESEAQNEIHWAVAGIHLVVDDKHLVVVDDVVEVGVVVVVEVGIEVEAGVEAVVDNYLVVVDIQLAEDDIC